MTTIVVTSVGGGISGTGTITGGKLTGGKYQLAGDWNPNGICPSGIIGPNVPFTLSGIIGPNVPINFSWIIGPSIDTGSFTGSVTHAKV